MLASALRRGELAVFLAITLTGVLSGGAVGGAKAATFTGTMTTTLQLSRAVYYGWPELQTFSYPVRVTIDAPLKADLGTSEANPFHLEAAPLASGPGSLQVVSAQSFYDEELPPPNLWVFQLWGLSGSPASFSGTLNVGGWDVPGGFVNYINAIEYGGPLPPTVNGGAPCINAMNPGATVSGSENGAQLTMTVRGSSTGTCGGGGDTIPFTSSITATGNARNVSSPPTPINTPTPPPRPSPPARDTTPPVLSSLHLSRNTFKIGTALPRISRRLPVGTTISFRLSELSSVTFKFVQYANGHKQDGKCVRNRHAGTRCRIALVRGALTVDGKEGINKLSFQGRLSRARTLAPGRYTLQVRAIDPTGNASKTSAVTIALVR